MSEVFNSELFGTIMQILIPIIATAIGTVITVYVKRWADVAKETKIGKETARYINLLEKTVYDVVQGLNQSTVQKLKEAAADGKLTPAEIEQVSTDAKLTILAIIGPKGIEVLSMAFADLQLLIACKIESTVLELKPA